MKTNMFRVMAAILAICDTMAIIAACGTYNIQKNTAAEAVQTIELIRTSQSWDGREKVVHEGEAVVEMVSTIHHGENRGKHPVILYMFYLTQKDVPLSVQMPEIPLY